jgi:protein arginine N-methyltransferase 1
MLDEHIEYLSDRIRLERFRAAIATVIRPGDQVVDLGCGSGILGLYCARAGAARVFAIESTPMIEVAREAFAGAGLAERGVLVRDHSFRVELPEPVDLLVCDHVGYFGFDYGIVHTLQDARLRFLKRGRPVIPSKIRLQVGAVQSEQAIKKVECWSATGVPPEFHHLRQFALNTKHAVEVTQDTLLSNGANLGDIDLRANNPDFFSWTAELHIERDGVVHGLAGWFDCELAEGVWMTNSPLSPDAIDRPQAFLPIDEAVPVSAGDVVKATIMARPAEHLIAWVVEFPATGRRFSHSTWQGMLLSPEDMIRAQPERIPRLSHEGQARMTVLQYCDGQRTARDIERAVLQDYPTLFPSPQEISRFVMQVLCSDTQ